MQYLEEVRPAIERLTNSFSTAMRVEVAIFDNTAKLFHCTPTYLKKKGKAVHAPSIQEVLNFGSVLVNKPGEMASCLGCRFKDNCPSTIEILSCIKLQGSVLGVVALTAFTKEGHTRISSNTQIYLDAVTEFSSLIGEMVLNKTGSHTSVGVEHLVSGVMEISQSALLLVDANGVITQHNTAAVNSLKFCKLSTSSLWHLLPEEIVHKLLRGIEFREAQITTNHFTARLSNRSIYVDNKVVAVVLRLSHIKDLDPLRQQAFACIIGSTPETRELHRMISKISNSPTPVLITGETGTGKELVAKSIHEQSQRKDFPFIAVNCSGIPETLFESELFGYEEGSFTGAKKGGKMGKFEMAQGGTLFLDEVGEMPISVQPKLLRVLQEYELERIGSSEKIPLNIRIVAATNRNLLDMIAEGTFREDLYYRIAVINLELPSLSERRSDILPIAQNYLDRLKLRLDTPATGFDEQVQAFLQNYPWKGNIRELQNVVEYAANLCETTLITKEDLPPRLREAFADTIRNEPHGITRDMESEITALLDKYGHTLEGKNRVAEALGISLRTLYRRLDKMEKFD